MNLAHAWRQAIRRYWSHPIRWFRQQKAADKIQLVVVVVQVITLILGIVAYFHTVVPAFERDKLREDVEALKKRKDAILATYVELIASAALLETGDGYRNFPNPFSSATQSYTPEYLARYWPPTPEAYAYVVLGDLRSHRLKEVAPNLSQSDIDEQIDSLRQRISDRAPSFRCSFNPEIWSFEYTKAQAVVEFAATTCVDSRMESYIARENLSPLDIKLLKEAHLDAYKRMEEEFRAICHEGHLEELTLKYASAWDLAKEGCAARARYANLAIGGVPFEPIEPFVPFPPSYTAQDKTAASAVAERAVSELRKKAFGLLKTPKVTREPLVPNSKQGAHRTAPPARE